MAVIKGIHIVPIAINPCLADPLKTDVDSTKGQDVKTHAPDRRRGRLC